MLLPQSLLGRPSSQCAKSHRFHILMNIVRIRNWVAFSPHSARCCVLLGLCVEGRVRPTTPAAPDVLFLGGSKAGPRLQNSKEQQTLTTTLESKMTVSTVTPTPDLSRPSSPRQAAGHDAQERDGGNGRTAPVPQSGGGTRQLPQAHGTSVHRQQQCRWAPPTRVARHGTSSHAAVCASCDRVPWATGAVRTCALLNQKSCGRYVAFSRRCGRRDCAPQPTLC